MPRTRTSALVWLASAQVAIGAAAVFARFGLLAAGPLSVSALRLAIGSLPLVIVAFARGAYRIIDRATERRLLLASFVLAAHFALWIGSLQFASVAVSTLLVCCSPIFTETYAFIRTRRIEPLVGLSVATAILGVAVVAGRPSSIETPLGVTMALGGAAAIAWYLILVRASDPRYGTLAVIARTYPLAAVMLSIGAVIAHDRIPPPTAYTAWGGILAMALFSQLFGHTALNVAVRSLTPTLVATATLLEPAIAAVAAAIVFHERLAPSTGAGAALVVAALILATVAERREEATA